MKPETTLSITLFSLMSLALAGGGQPQPVTLNINSSMGCHPYIGTVVFGVKPDPAASRRMAQLFTEDQDARKTPNIDWKKVSFEDEKRRRETLNLLRDGRLSAGVDYFYAAFVFQHGDCPEHYRLANLLAQQAITRNYPAARWIYAATYDRWQRSLGQPQKYGTQYTSVGDCNFKLEPYDPATTDAERSRYGVPPIEEALRRADEINADCRASRQNP